MGQRGPPKTPTSILEKRGSWRANQRGDEPRPERGRPEPPDWIADDPLAERVYGEVVDLLDSMAVSTRVDGFIVAQFARTWSRWVAAERALISHGGTSYESMNEQGAVYWRHYPEVSESASLLQALVRIEKELGLTPAARASLSVTPDPKQGRDEKTLRDKLLSRVSDGGRKKSG